MQHVKTSSGIVSPCDTCLLNKRYQQPRAKQANISASQPLEMFYTDVLGPMRPMRPVSLRQSSYAVKYADHCTRFEVCYFMSSKAEVLKTLVQFVQDLAIPNGLHAFKASL